MKLAFVAHVARLTRSSMVEALESMYVKVARARGLPERLVVLRHAVGRDDLCLSGDSAACWIS